MCYYLQFNSPHSLPLSQIEPQVYLYRYASKKKKKEKNQTELYIHSHLYVKQVCTNY